MKTYMKWSRLVLSALPCLGFAMEPGFYGDVAAAVSFGPSAVIASASGFGGSGGTITGGVTDLYGLRTNGAAGAVVNLGYNVNSWLGLEANYNWWGEQDLNLFTGQITRQTGGFSGELTGQSVGGNLVAYVPVNSNNLNLFAKVGVAALFADLTVNDPASVIFFNGGSYSQDSTKAAMTYGTGVQYQYNPNISFLLSWNGISQFDNNPIDNLGYNMASFGIRYSMAGQSPHIYEK